MRQFLFPFVAYSSMKAFLFISLQLISAHSYSQSNVSIPAAQAAQLFLQSLSISQKITAQIPYSDSTRKTWSNLPYEQYTRRGLWTHDMNDTQKIKLHALLRTVLSAQGYQKIMTIIQFDDQAHQRLEKAQNPIASRYGSDHYWITLFGEPSISQNWAFQFEGHHISLNFTFSQNGISCTPMFIGINPALTTTGPYAGQYHLSEENEYGKQFFNSLSPEQKKQCILDTLPTNIDVLANLKRKTSLESKTTLTPLNNNQIETQTNIIKAWVENLHPSLAQQQLTRIQTNSSNFDFFWLGTTDPNALHYYRLQSNTTIIECTNRDQGLYHLHTLWRDVFNDFGGD
jgi:hypothetical protein